MDCDAIDCLIETAGMHSAGGSFLWDEALR